MVWPRWWLCEARTEALCVAASRVALNWNGWAVGGGHGAVQRDSTQRINIDRRPVRVVVIKVNGDYKVSKSNSIGLHHTKGFAD